MCLHSKQMCTTSFSSYPYSRDRSAASTLREQPRRPPAFVFDSPDATPAASFVAYNQLGIADEERLTTDDSRDQGDDKSDAGHERIQHVLDGYKPVINLDTGALSYALAHQQAMSPPCSFPGSDSQSSLGPARPSLPRQGSSTDSPSVAMDSNATDDIEDDDTFDAEGLMPINGFDGAESDEEDDFEFSLHGRDATSSFDAIPPGIIAHPPANASLLSSPSSGSLPSIAEAVESGEAANATTGAVPQNNEDAALKAAQQARRQARRRVNISGRVPLPISIPRSPDFAYDANPPSPSGSATAPSTPSAESAARRPSATGGSPRPATPSSANRPMSPSSPLAATLLRSRSGRLLKTRQRSQTDPASQSPQPSPTKRTGATSPPVAIPSLRHRAYTSQSLSTSPLAMINSAHRPLTAADARSPSSETGDPVKPSARRVRSTGSSDGALSPLRPFTPRPTLTLTSASDSAQSTAQDLFSADGDTNSTAAPSAAISGQTSPTTPLPRTRRSPTRSPSKMNDPYVSFPITRRPVPPVQPPKQSALSVMLKSEDSATSGSTNPFNENYGALFAPAVPAPSGPASRRGGSAANSSAFEVTMYYSFSKEKGKPLKMSLKADLLVEEVVGCALWKYWESERAPSLCPTADGSNDANWEDRSEEDKKRLSPANWVLRIADEDEDGEVDDDFPAPDRTRGAKGFGTCFSIMEASSAQFKQNLASDAQIQRRPSRIIRRIQKATISPQPSSNNLAPPAAQLNASLAAGGAPSIMSASFVGTPAKSYSMSGATAPLVYLKIRIHLQGLEEINTTLHVPVDMYMADVLDMICKKRPKYLQNPKDWMLTVPDRGVIVPLDRTVESLQGAHQLALQKKGAAVAGLAGNRKASTSANTNPNGK